MADLQFSCLICRSKNHEQTFSCTQDKEIRGFSLGKKFCSYPGVLTQANYINALQFYSTAWTTLDELKGKLSAVLSKKKNPIWGSVVDGRLQPEG